MNEEKRLHGYSEKLHELSHAELKKKKETEREASSNSQSREYQRKQIKKDVQVRSKTGESVLSGEGGSDLFGKIGQKSKEAVSIAGDAILKVVEDHPVIITCILFTLLTAVLITSVFSSCSLAVAGVDPSCIVSTFTADDDEILEVDEDFSSLESDLSDEIDRIESDNPGYDEYSYDLAAIEHDPFELAALLTVLYEDYTEREVSSELSSILESQYELTLNPVTETRTRTVTRWHWVTYTTASGRTRRRFESYEDEEEYDYTILYVTLTNNGVGFVAENSGLTEDQLMRYQLLLATRGNKEYLFE